MRPRFLSKYWRALPDEVIGDPTRPHMWRWYLWRGTRLQIVVHKWLRSDEPVPHDHAWWNVSIRLRGRAMETDSTPDSTGIYWATCRALKRFTFRRATDRHFVTLLDGETLWTLFITGPHVREWGYWIRGQFVPWKNYRSRNKR